jgi:MATE family multidrug resistance protein
MENSVNRSILKLAIPNIISNLSVPLLSMVDTILMGHLPDVYYIGAIAVGSMIFNFIYWGFGFLRMGTTGLTAQAFGNNNSAEMINLLTRAFTISAGGGLLLILLQWPLSALAFYLVDATADVEIHARSYFDIRIYAAPATLTLYAFHGWFLGMQNARFPLYLTVIVNLLNIAFNLIFIEIFHMRSDGVALGTVIAQYLGLAIAFVLLFRHYRHLFADISFARTINIAALKTFVSVNFDIFIRTLLLVFAFSFFTAKSAEFGEDILAANTILMQFWNILAFGVDGFAFAAESLVGRFFGARDEQGLKTAIRYIFYWGMGLGFLYTLVYFIFGNEIIGIFTNKEALILLASSYLWWTIAAPLINSVCYIWDGIYIGATSSAAMRNSTIVATILVFMPAFYLGRHFLGNHGLWLAMTLFMFTRGLTLSLMAGNSVYRWLKTERKTFIEQNT